MYAGVGAIFQGPLRSTPGCHNQLQGCSAGVLAVFPRCQWRMQGGKLARLIAVFPQQVPLSSGAYAGAVRNRAGADDMVAVGDLHPWSCEAW